jgi:hypothetical protein
MTAPGKAQDVGASEIASSSRTRGTPRNDVVDLALRHCEVAVRRTEAISTSMKSRTLLSIIADIARSFERSRHSNLLDSFRGACYSHRDFRENFQEQ